MKPNTIFAVGHGPRNSLDQLTVGGQHSAEVAAVRLRGLIIARGLPLPLIISGELTRNCETADILAETLGVEAPITSHRLTLAGDRPEGIRDFAELTAASLSDEHISLLPDQPVIVVTENPIPAMAKGDYSLLMNRGLEPGEVVEYDAERWDYDRFNQAAEQMIRTAVIADQAASLDVMQHYAFV